MPPPDVQALLATDLVDSTGTTERIGGGAAAELWSAHDRIARDLLGRWHGREIDKTDGFLLLFDSAGAAAGYALDYHRAIAGLPHPLLARAGLHVAAVVLKPNTPEDVAHGAKPFEIGDWGAKALVARVMMLAPGGRTLLTPEAAAALRAAGQHAAPRDRPQVASLGHWRLQGLAAPVELFGLHDDATDRGPIPDAAKAHGVVRQGERWIPRREIRHTLPAERDSFVGRRDALIGIAERFAGGSRLVSVLGAGGTGKTRLALRFGADWIGDFSGGVWFCDLSSAQGLEGLVFAVAQGLELRLAGDDPVRQIGEALAGRPGCLVVLDNFERVAAHAAGTVDRWLSTCAEARFLVTSRTALRVRGETLLMLAPLEADEAADLFVRRVEDSGGALDGSAGEQVAIRSLVRLLDGLPLAIELAASRAKVMSPGAMLLRMKERFKLLTSHGGRPERQATMRAAIDWSWGLLKEGERSTLAQLSVFAGGFDVDDAEAVLVPTLDDEPLWAIDSLQSLLEDSMLRKVGPDRFDMLSSLQEYAVERLAEPARNSRDGEPLRSAVERRHWTHFAGFDARRATRGGGIALDNLVVACRRATAAGDGVAAARALGAAWAVLRLTGPVGEAIALGREVRACGGLGPLETSLVLRVMGEAADIAGDVEDAAACHEAALQAAEASGDRSTLAWALHAAGQHRYRRGDTDGARRLLEKGLEVAEALGDPGLLCGVHMAIGTLWSRLGQPRAARVEYEAALKFARRDGNPRMEAGALGNLAMLASEDAADDAAQRQYEEALALSHQINDRRWEGNMRCNLGLLLQERGLHAAAREQFDRSLAIAREIGHAMLQGTLQCNLGILAQDSGDLLTAGRHHADAVAVARRMADPRAEGQFLGYLARCKAASNDPEGAFDAFDQGEVCLRASGDTMSLAFLLCQRAGVEARLGRRAEALDRLEVARSLCNEPTGELRALLASTAEALERATSS